MTRQKASNQQTRRANEQLVLHTIHDRGPISRADVARATGLTRTAVSDLVASLMADDLVVSVGMGPSTGGKAPILLEVPSDARHVVGVEVDRHRISGAVVNLRGQVRHRRAVELGDRDGPEALDVLRGLVVELAGVADRPLVGVGVGTSGLIDSVAGVVRWAVGLDWHDVPVGPQLAELTGLPTVVINDSQAAAMAEWTYGRREGASSMVVVKVGEGIGAGIIVDGRIYAGEGSGAGEIGHSRVADRGLACRCGSDGCLETVASLRAVVAEADRLAGSYQDTALAAGQVSQASLLAAFESGDSLARQVILDSGTALGRVLGTVIGTLGCRDVALIGPMADFGPAWLERVRAEAQRSALPSLVAHSTIRLGRSGFEAVTLGAAATLMNSELGLALAA